MTRAEERTQKSVLEAVQEVTATLEAGIAVTPAAGVATSAKQDTGNTSLSSIDGKFYADSTVASASLNNTKLEISTIGCGSAFAHVGNDITIGDSLTGTISFEATLDGTNWFGISGTDIRALDGQVPSSTGVAGIFAFNVAGFTKFRLNSAVQSPAISCYIRTSKAVGVINQLQAITFVDGSGVTQPISAASLPLATDASTETTLALLNAKFSLFKTRSDTFTSTTNGTTVDVSGAPLKFFSVQVKMTGSVTSWDVRLEGSLNNTQFTQILQHTNATPGDGLITFSGASTAPVLYFRSRASGLILGAGTNIVVTVLGVQ